MELKLKLSNLKTKLKQKRKLKLKLVRIRKKALRNSKKAFATTKSFNDKTNDFVPQVKQVHDVDIKLYQRLKAIGKVSKSVTYKEWLKFKNK